MTLDRSAPQQPVPPTTGPDDHRAADDQPATDQPPAGSANRADAASPTVARRRMPPHPDATTW
ncbi:hypothetical protein [Micromonospora sp. NBC_01813]|uniref:hypothetical protein n=1 Tax=Micromonospora sp. NBC_01813 TaxID=2975988 RepID=UPI002DDB3E40|nr:hypothetical protein [Micromonospora sp. NBC_01813]WSA08326.1 hypothetical protein OG958_29710 [Micromonospora sp. NBC_01813]